jgi:uncharacterized SAM-binding protein YcdF (DUF218 family)/lysophospholipase L1-like esterase
MTLSSADSRAAVPPVDAVPVATASARTARRRRPSPFVRGLLAGIALVFAVRTVINETALADRVVSRLIPTDSTGSADAIVVLGAGVVGPCEPNLNAMRRVILGVRLWRDHRAPLLFFTGGKPVGLPCPVSVVMSDLAGALGVPADVRHTEEVSRSTHENAAMSAPLLQKLGVHRVLLVTDRLHMRRAEGTFAAAGFQIERAAVPVYASHPDNVSMLLAGLREYVALLYYRHRGWLAGPPRAPAPAPAAARIAATIPVMLSDPPASDRPVVILGASYAAGWKPARLGGSPVVNAGVPGEQSWEMLARFDRDVVARKPRAVILWGFINDIHRAPKDRIDPAVTRARDSFTTMIAKARAAGIEPILATELTIRPLDGWGEWAAGWLGWMMGKTSYQEMVNSRVIETNAWLRELARKEGLLLVDLHPQLSEPSGERRRAFAKDDGSHIPPAGYAVIAAYAEPLVDAHLRREAGR